MTAIALAARATSRTPRTRRTKDPLIDGAERVRVLGELLERRHDLRGVHAHADFVDESVRWSA